MRRQILLDTGPLVALLNHRDAHHDWAVDEFQRHAAPFLTCDAVITEAMHMVGNAGLHPGRVLRLVRTGALALDFRTEDEVETLEGLVEQYRNVPMDFADACLVRMSELHPDSQVLTLDSDFDIYRRHRREAIPTIRPR